ncbi:lipase family protein [Chitinivorax sp. PXF-14]|uniref:lipase family protein n=1 Tax=Chitinivorax sp. PXF-14 TaxID=3230488 RepID=UPI003465620B
MVDLRVLDVLIGLSLVYLLLSSVCSAVMEAWNNLRNRRGYYLERHLVRLFGDRAKDEIINGDDLQSLWTRPVRSWWHKSDFPSYIPTNMLSARLIAWFRHAGPERMPPPPNADGKIPPGQANLAQLMLRHSGDDTALAVEIGKWFNQTMERMTGEFARETKHRMLLLAVLIAVAANADSIRLFGDLYTDPMLRDAIVKQAEAKIANPPATPANKPSDGNPADAQQAPPAATAQAPDAKAAAPNTATESSAPAASTTDSSQPQQPPAPAGNSLEQLKKDIGSLPVLGWTKTQATDTAAQVEQRRWGAMLQMLLGYLITAFALLFGADFWFNTLQKLLKVRTSLRSKDEPDAAATTDQTAAQAGSPAAAVAATPACTVAQPLLTDAYCYAHVSSYAYRALAADVGQTLALGSRRYVIDQYFSRRGTQAVLLTPSDDASTAVLAFRGTELKEWMDVRADIDFPHVHWAQAGFDHMPVQQTVHKGFADALRLVLDEQLINSLRDKRLIITGHSLGGALAALCAMVLKQRGLCLTAVYTYGQPRVGDLVFSQDYDVGLHGITYRIVNHRDLVPRVPTRTMQYRHAGQCLYLDTDGIAHLEPGLWQILLDVVPFDGNHWQDGLKQALGDHSISEYQRLLQANLG